MNLIEEQELAALNKRIKSIGYFMVDSMAFRMMQREDRELLYRQYRAMQQYAFLLAERIKRGEQRRTVRRLVQA